MRLRLAAMVVCTVFAAYSNTIISQSNIRAGNGALASGYLTIRPNVAFTAADGTHVQVVQMRVNLVNARFSVALAANDCSGCTGTAYLVKWQLNGAAPWTETWVVPLTSRTLTPADVIVSATPTTASLSIQPQQIGQGGAVAGQALVWNGSSWAPGAAGGGWSVNTVACAAAPLYDFALGNIQQITLSCDVTSGSTANIPVGQPVMFLICQGETAHSWAWPGAVSNGVTVGTSANKCSSQWFYSADGVHLVSQGIGVVNQ